MAGQYGIGGVMVLLTGTPAFLGLNLPVTTAFNIGVIYKNADRFLHDYEHLLSIGDNTFLGKNAGNFTLGSAIPNEGSVNTGIGAFAGMALTLGGYNTFIGTWAGYHTTISNACVFVGADAGFENVGGDQCTYVGTFCGFTGVNAQRNSYLGYRAGYFNLAGNDNVLMGWSAGEQNLASYQVVLGGYAGQALTTGAMNVMVGFQAGQRNNIGMRNCFIGTMAGWYNVAGNYNCFLGMDTGFDPAEDLAANRLVNDTNIIAIGYGATKNNAAALDNVIVIGTKAWATKSNQTMIGTYTTTECYLRGGLLLDLASVLAAANNAAAAALGVLIGGFYRTNADPSILCIRSA